MVDCGQSWAMAPEVVASASMAEAAILPYLLLDPNLETGLVFSWEYRDLGFTSSTVPVWGLVFSFISKPERSG